MDFRQSLAAAQHQNGGLIIQMQSDWERVQEIFLRALEQAPPARADFVRARCHGNASIYEEVMSLLGSHDEPNDFIEKPLLPVTDTSFETTETELRPGEVIGSYTIVSLIGSAGMGEVYLARDNEFDRQVAIKLIKRGLVNAESIRQFRREERILATLNHPNIARFYGGAVKPGAGPCFVMEYVPGTRLDDYSGEHQLTIRQRLELFRKVCAAVHFAHQHLIVHRDIKPSNILVTPEGEPKLLDFGIGKLLKAGPDFLAVTMTVAPIMTPEYASPEHIRGEPVTTASDIYSLGVLLYELLSGQRPYKLTTRQPEEMAKIICETEPVRPSSAVAKGNANSKLTVRNSRILAGDLDNIVLMAMRKEPARRYASAAQLSEDIRRHLAGMPVIARRDTLRYRARKFVGRNKVAVAAALLIAAALLAGIIGTSFEARRAEKERDGARLAQAEAERLNGFLQNILASADPDGMGRDVKVVQVLDAAAKRIDSELADQPAILAQAHFTIARAYASLRQGAPAEEHARKALAIDERIYGIDHPATAQVMFFLGYALRAFRRFDEAEPLLRHALAVQRQLPPANRKDLTNTMVTLGNVLAETGRAKEAAPLIDEVVEIDRKAYGNSSVEYAEALNSLGNLRVDLKDRTGAKAAYRESIGIHRKLRPIHFSMLIPMQNLAELLLQEHNLAEAEPLLRETEMRCREMVGKSNPTYGNIRGFFGYFEFLKSDYSSAVPDLQRYIGDLAGIYPKNEPSVIGAEILLGLALTRTGNPAVAERYLRAAYENGKAGIDSDFGPVEDLAGPLSECLLAQKRYSEAAPLLRASYAQLRARHGEQDALTLEAKRRLKSLPAMP